MTTTANTNPSLAIGFTLNLVIGVLATVLILVTASRVSNRASRVRVPILEARLQPKLHLIARKDPETLAWLSARFPSLDPTQIKARFSDEFFSVIVASRRLEFWFGGSEPLLAGTLSSSDIADIRVGESFDGRAMRHSPALLLVLKNGTSLPLIISNGSTVIVRPLGQSALTEIRGALAMLIASDTLD